MTRVPIDRELDEKVVDLVIRARQEHEIPEKCYGKLVCQRLGLTLERQLLPSGQEGMHPGDGHIVVSTRIVNLPRIEYTIFHEIMHHLIEEDDELYEYLHEFYHDDVASFDATLERWCQVGAAEFMMPRARVHALMAEYGFTIDLLQRIEEINDASTQAAAVQLAVCAPVDCYVVLCSHGGFTGGSYPPVLYVEQARKRDDWEYPLVTGTPIPEDHLFHQVWESRRSLSGPSYIPFRSGKTFPCVHAEAKVVGSRVAGLLCLEVPPAKDQM